MALSNILCGFDWFNTLRVSSKPYADENIELFGNCCIMCASYEDNKYKMISSANTYHLNTNKK